jgi:hypothetical protein
MRFSLPAVPADLAPIAQGPEINLESGVRISPVPVYELGEVRVDAAGVAAWYANAGVTIPAGGLDLHLRNDSSLENLTALPSVTLTTTLTGAVAATSLASFTVPSWTADQSMNWPLGQGADFVGVGAGNSLLLVTAIGGLSASANLPANSVWSVWGSPLEENFVFHGFKRNVDGPIKTPKFVGIPDGYDESAAVKKGRSEPGSLQVDMVHISSMGGISRYNGRKVALMVDIVKNGVVQTDRLIYTGYGISAKVSRGDGDGEVLESSTGPFESSMNFVAP